MSSLLSREPEPCGRQFYYRKENTLGVLISNFSRLYDRDGVDLIGLDDKAGKLASRQRWEESILVEGFRRTSLGSKGIEAEGLRENLGMTGSRNLVKVSNSDESEEPFSSTIEVRQNLSSSKMDNRRENSLWLLSQDFVKLFLCSDVEVMKLDIAAKAMLS